ncbi:DUF4174 domain-containing protein [Hymenobacter sp. HMF4947]|uniref:DUF4174 domain-containing protein n=1 Tax=Hymenobacter ginkgonis TaxID=2682976 RepID=A0A7K1TDD2_9BACT|nr:DUF4174 domain-containing protein [Hymenobacter ginkgonis]MVN76415.1 DUF4174 domain-containing protein [Hymenobacter ginkgonis]
MPIRTWIFGGLVALALVPALAATSALPPGLAQTLRASRWKQRVLLIGAPSATQADFQRQKTLLATEANGLAERDFQVLEVLYDQLSPADRQYWQQQLGQALAGFVVVLVGKDGGVKQTSARPLPPAALFSTVDKMPMRREEMGRKDKN